MTQLLGKTDQATAGAGMAREHHVGCRAYDHHTLYVGLLSSGAAFLSGAMTPSWEPNAKATQITPKFAQSTYQKLTRARWAGQVRGEKQAG